MRAHLVQFDIAWENKQANYDTAERLIARAEPDAGDLVVLPEMFDTGFSFNLESTADTDLGTLRYLTQLAEDLGVYVHGARSVLPGPAPGSLGHNRATIISPTGRMLADYTKIHPFSFGKESERFQGGSEVLTYRWDPAAGAPRAEPEGENAGRGSAAAASSLTVCPALCYDLRFPELFRLGLLRGAELFAIGANWPEARQHHWRALLIARAIENQAFVVGVNRTGRDPALNYIGGSLAVGPRGEVLGELGPEEGVLSVEIEPREVRAWRDKFPAWRDIRLMAGAERAAASKAPAGGRAPA